jgi:hypothetical protein
MRLIQAALEIGSDQPIRTNDKKEPTESTISKPRETAV